MRPDLALQSDASSEDPTWRWVAAPREDLRWCEWEGDCAVYHRPSGKTHFLNEAARVLIERVLNEPHEAGRIADAFARTQGVDPDEEFRTQVWGLLVRLEELGLVERA